MAIAEPLVPSRVLSIATILEEFQDRLERAGGLNAWYAKLAEYYDPRGVRNLGGQSGPSVLAMNSQGRPLLRQVGEAIDVQRTYSSHRLSPIVDDFASLIGRLPTTRVDNLDPEQSPQGEEKAEKLTKYLYSTYENSRMEYQQAWAGHCLSGLGDVVYMLEPNSEDDRVVWVVHSPATCLPSFYAGHRRFELYDLIQHEVWSLRQIRRVLGHEPHGDSPEDRTVVTYVSPFQRTMVVGTKYPQAIAHVEWDLGFCPAQWVFNKVTGSMGMSDIGNSLGQQDLMDFAFNVWADGIVHLTYPIIGIKNPMNVAESGSVGPGEPPITLQGDGDIIVRNTQGNPQAISEIIQMILGDVSSSTGSAPVRQEGAMHGSVITGRAVHAVQGPQSTRIDFKQSVLGAAIRELNSMTLAMQEKAPHLKDFEGDIYGNYRGQSFQTRMKASDIDGWYRNKVTWEAMVGMNLQQKLQVAYEGKVAGMWDGIYGMQMVGVDDPIGMQKRVEAEKLREAQMQQGAQPGGAAGKPPEGGQGGAPPQGGQGQQPIQMLMRPRQMNQQGPGGMMGKMPEPGAPPAPPSGGDLKQALIKIADKLKGAVWKVGDSLVIVTDHRDYPQVAGIAKKMGLTVKQMSEDKLPDGAERVV